MVKTIFYTQKNQIVRNGHQEQFQEKRPLRLTIKNNKNFKRKSINFQNKKIIGMEFYFFFLF